MTKIYTADAERSNLRYHRNYRFDSRPILCQWPKGNIDVFWKENSAEY